MTSNYIDYDCRKQVICNKIYELTLFKLILNILFKFMIGKLRFENRPKGILSRRDRPQ